MGGRRRTAGPDTTARSGIRRCGRFPDLRAAEAPENAHKSEFRIRGPRDLTTAPNPTPTRCSRAFPLMRTSGRMLRPERGPPPQRTTAVTVASRARTSWLIEPRRKRASAPRPCDPTTASRAEAASSLITCDG